MTLPVILMILGLIAIVGSFFLKDGAKQTEKQLDDLSISVFQETNNLKKRLKIVEEELLLEPQFHVKKPSVAKTTKAPTPPAKPIHDILKSQVIALNKQGLSIAEISTRSTLTEEQVRYVLATGGSQ
ncbi:hypothetical protein CH76_01740 [Lysinibacillus sp. BF-4]|uniref:hypothetical protein n=1 Tax=Lysinibacillus sp. BF-4 TaxID=1473546 RepID=UPI000504A31D|nr:hypothetical protein [Lysinibacillus sp. BF-4]KFL44556.1 hypothetical protein CH76_01740 [Lysinibacillus sp. BF-4]